MQAIEHFIGSSVLYSWVALILFFFVLTRSADIFVDSSIALANKFKIPKLVIGIVLVSLATTAPELTVSLMAALRGNPEMALGNAMGSVICDDGLALPLCGIISAAAIPVVPAILKTSGLFLLGVEILSFLFIVGDRTLERREGIVLVVLFVGYMVFLFRRHRRHEGNAPAEVETTSKAEKFRLWKIVLMFALSLAGIIVSSEIIITSAGTIAESLGIPNTVIAMTLVAFGTSIPEIATCIAAARKNEGEVAIGNILGADIMNICWVAGASAIANDLTLQPRELYFMFPAMFIIVGVMLAMLWTGYRLTRRKSIVLLGCYILYLTSFFVVF